MLKHTDQKQCMEAWIYFGCGSRGRAHNGDGAWAAGSQSRKLSGHISSPTQKTAGELEVGRGHKPSQHAASSPGKQLWRCRISPFPVSLLWGWKHCNQYPYSQVLSIKVWIKGNTAPKVWQISKLCPSQDLVLTFMSTAETCVLSPFLPVLGIIFKQVSWCIVNMTMYIWSVFFERFWCMWCSLQLGNCLNKASSLLLVKVSSWLCNPAMCLTLSLR